MREGGVILGRLIAILMEVDTIFCESLVSNLMTEFPYDPSDLSDSTILEYVAIVMGQLAIAAKNDSVRERASHVMLMICHLRFPRYVSQTFLRTLTIFPSAIP